MKENFNFSGLCCSNCFVLFVKTNSLNSIITSNIAALTDNDNGYPVTIETVVYKASSSLNAPIDWDDNQYKVLPSHIQRTIC